MEPLREFNFIDVLFDHCSDVGHLWRCTRYQAGHGSYDRAQHPSSQDREIIQRETNIKFTKCFYQQMAIQVCCGKYSNFTYMVCKILLFFFYCKQYVFSRQCDSDRQKKSTLPPSDSRYYKTKNERDSAMLKKILCFSFFNSCQYRVALN